MSEETATPLNAVEKFQDNVRFDRNLFLNLSDLENTFGEDAPLAKDIIVFMAHQFKSDLFGYTSFSLMDFCKKMKWSSPVSVEDEKRLYFTTLTLIQMPTQKKTYSKEFKEEAVRLAQQGKATETARNLGVPISVLRRWIKELEENGEKAFPGKGHTQDEELRQLQRENQRLKETVEILKKAMGIFTSRS